MFRNNISKTINYSGYIKKFWKDNFLIGLILFGSAISQTIASVLNTAALNALIAFDFNGFFVAALQMFGAYLFFLLFTYLQVVKSNQTIQKMITSIRQDITERIESTNYKYFHEKEIGTYASWLSNDMNIIENSTYQRIYDVASGVIGTITSVIALFFFHWSLVLWSFIVTGITLLLPRIFQRKMSEASLKVSEENESFLSKTNDVLRGFDTLFSYNLLSKISKDIKKASTQLADVKISQARIHGKVAILGALGNVFGQLSILVLTGYLAFQGLLSIGSIATTGNLASTIFNTVGNISQQIASIKATQSIFDKFDTIKVAKNGKNEKIKQLNDGFQLKNLEYSYGDKKIFSGLNYSFDLGKKYAVVGASGSGKSTLLNILNGKLPDYKGSVTLSNKELKHLEGKELRNQIIYIDQVPYLFEGTIRYNITLGEDLTDEQLQKAIQDSDLEDLIHSLPHGLDTPVGEAGRSFSGGQRQRIALARGLVRGKTCILMDEGTSNLDETSALKIEERLINNSRLTVIMITHHLKKTTEEKLDGVLRIT